MKTYSLRAGDIDRRWHVLDATGIPMGRLASRAAVLLRGKHKPTFSPHLDMGDFVVIINAEKVHFSGNEDDKVYARHSGYPGGLKTRTLRQMRETRPDRLVEGAVKGMLPHNRLGAAQIRHLKVYAGPQHPHGAQIAAGTGARAKKRVAAAVAAAAAPVRRAPVAAAPPAEPAASAPPIEEAVAAAPKPARAAPRKKAAAEGKPAAAEAAAPKRRSPAKAAADPAGEAKPATRRRTKATTEPAGGGDEGSAS